MVRPDRGPRGNQTTSFYPDPSTWTPGLIPDLLSPPAERLASIGIGIGMWGAAALSLTSDVPLATGNGGPRGL